MEPVSLSPSPWKNTDLFPKWQKKMVLSRDTDAEDMLAERHIYRTIYFGTARAWWTIWSSYGMMHTS